MTTNLHEMGVLEFVKEGKQLSVEDKRSEFEAILKIIRRFKTLNAATRILEIGTGLGWLVVLCEQAGMKCKGIEVIPELVDYGRKLGKRYGIDPDIEVGNIAEKDIGASAYDVIIATSTFEHVKDWKEGLTRVFTGLKPGGVFYFYSTNKFCFKSGEYDFPFYGWLPNRWRYRLRVARQGPDIMRSGIDWNQFTYFQLRRFFKRLGFARVLDRVDVLDADNLNHPTAVKKIILRILQRVKFLRHLVLFFSDGTHFICIK